MNKYSEEKIKELSAYPLSNSKELKNTKKLIGRQVYWVWKEKIYTIKYACPMTHRIWFTENFNGWCDNVNAISEMYLIPQKQKI